MAGKKIVEIERRKRDGHKEDKEQASKNKIKSRQTWKARRTKKAKKQKEFHLHWPFA